MMTRVGDHIRVSHSVTVCRPTRQVLRTTDEQRFLPFRDMVTMQLQLYTRDVRDRFTHTFQKTYRATNGLG